MSDQIEEVLEDFRIHLFESGRVSSEMTIESYLGNVRQLLEWLQEEDVELENLDRMVIMNYLQYLRDLGYKATTYNTKINSLISFNSYLKKEGITDRDMIFGKDKIQTSTNREIEVYSEEEIELIEVYLEDGGLSVRDRLIITMLKDLGLRTSELTNITLESLDLVGLQIEIHGKNNKRRTLPIKSSLADIIKKYIGGERKDNKHSASPHLLVSERSGRLHRNTILDITKKMGKELDIKSYNHKFRHTLATSMAKNKVPIQVIQKVLGHSQVQTTIDYYVNIDQHQLKQALENI